MSRNASKQTFTFNGKKYQIYGSTRKERLEKWEKRKKELEEGEERMNNPTVRQYYDYFTIIRKNRVSPNTILKQKTQFKIISEIVMPNNRKFGDLKIKEVKRKDIELVRQLLLDDGKTPENLNICFAHLNHVFSKAVIDETINKNPCRGLEKLKRKAPSISLTKHRALTQEETERFFEAAIERNSFYTNAFLVMLKTGLRIGELAALYPRDIDSKARFIYVRRSVTRDEIGQYVIGDNTKTKSGQRDIPLTEDVEKILRKQQEQNRVFFGFEGNNGLLFRSSKNEILREYTINREIKRICNQSGIEYFTCHAFRNTFATRFIEQRPQDYKILSEILGHKDISITLNLYTHVMVEKKVEAMNAILINIS